MLQLWEYATAINVVSGFRLFLWPLLLYNPLSERHVSKNPKKRCATYILLIEIDVRYLRYLRSNGSLLLISVLLIFVVTGLDTIAPWSIKFIADNVIGGELFDNPAGMCITDRLDADQHVLTLARPGAVCHDTAGTGNPSLAFGHL